MSASHNLTRAQIRALRYFVPGYEHKPGAPVPAARTHARLEAMGLTAWVALHGSAGADETTAEGLRILSEIDAAKKSERSA